MWLSGIYQNSLTVVKQNTRLSHKTERFDQMSEQSHHHSPASLVTLVELCERIAAEAPALEVLALYEFPKPFLKVKDSTNGLVVALSSEAELTTYLEIIHSHKGGRRHA